MNAWSLEEPHPDTAPLQEIRPAELNLTSAHLASQMILSENPGADSASEPLEPALSDWLQTAFEALNEPLFVFQAVRDDQGEIVDLRYVYLNAAAAQMYHRTPEEVLGHGLRELFPSVASLGIFDSYVEPLRSGHATSMRVPAFNESGVTGAFDVAAFPLGASVVVSAHDVTAEVSAKSALESSEALLRVVLDSTSDAIMRFGPDLRVRYVNRRLVEFTGISAQEWEGKTFAEAGYPDELTVGWDEYSRRVFATGEPVRHEFAVDLPVGHRWFETRVDPEFDSGGNVTHVITTSRDVTERVLAEQSLRQSQALLAVVLDGSRDATTTYAPDMSIEYVNRRTAELSGIPATDWIGKTIAELGYPAASVAYWNAQIAQVFETGQPQTMRYAIDNTEGARWYEAILAPQVDSDGSVAHVISTNRDITDWVVAENTLREMATHDSLTNLANRRALVSDIARGLQTVSRTGSVMAVLMIDLDRFKIFNDSLGYEAGDALLKQASQRLLDTVAPSCLVGRMGGDEFVVVMRDIAEAADAIRTAWDIVRAFRRAFSTPEGDHFSTASIGVAISQAGSTAEHLLADADSAMYAAKDSGRDQMAVFNDDLRAAAAAHLAIEDALRHALAKDQLEVWYQPEVDLFTGEARAAEALLRWNHPSGELLTAARFVDVAEDTGLIFDIGAWALTQACTQAAAWNDGPVAHQMVVRINISARQLGDIRLLPDIDHALSSSGVNPNAICLEITETALLRDSRIASDNIQGIRARGLTLAIDDFGTGYASLTYLHRYPIDIVKIDKSFVSGIAINEYDRQLVGALMAMANFLDLKVVAEGVEVEDQAEVLRSLGCSSAQGYLYSKAVPASQVTPMLQRGFPHP